MLVTIAKWKKHSVHAGFTIWKRVPGTGTSGGTWMVDSTTIGSLARAKAYAESLVGIITPR